MSTFGFSNLSRLRRRTTGQHISRALCYRRQRQNYSIGFYTLAAAFASGFALHKLQRIPCSSLHTVYADGVESEPTEEEQSKFSKEEQRWKRYDRTTWRNPWAGSVDDHLRTDSLIFRPDMSCGITRYDVCAVPSTIPGTCYASCTIGDFPSHYWLIFGIYDGHNGNSVSHHLFTNLPKAVIDAIAGVYSKHSYLPSFHVDLGHGPEIMDYWTAKGLGRPYPPAEEIDAVLKRVFMSLDTAIVTEPADRALQLKSGSTMTDIGQITIPSYDDVVASLAKAHAASSALVALYESDVRRLRLALAGGSRAVLGRRVIDSEDREIYEAHVLTTDLQTPEGFIDDPPRRDEHNDPRILTYSFGDGPSKWSIETRKQIYEMFPFLEDERPRDRVSAEPVISTVETQPGDFIILANKGLWASLSNEEAVGLVALWLRKYEKFAFKRTKDRVEGVYDPETGSVVPITAYSGTAPQIRSSPFIKKDVFDESDLPISCPRENDTFMYRKWGIAKTFVVVDLNVAQHLVRNSLGGANRDVMEALLKMPVPRSRQHRDDIVVQVAFFT